MAYLRKNYDRIIFGPVVLRQRRTGMPACRQAGILVGTTIYYYICPLFQIFKNLWLKCMQS